MIPHVWNQNHVYVISNADGGILPTTITSEEELTEMLTWVHEHVYNGKFGSMSVAIGEFFGGYIGTAAITDADTGDITLYNLNSTRPYKLGDHGDRHTKIR